MLYPNRQGKKDALRHYKASVKTEVDVVQIGRALNNYLASGNVKRGYVKNGSTWFNEWRDWVNPTDIMMKGNTNATHQRRTATGNRAGGATTAEDLRRTLELSRQSEG